ncbi:MAG: DUF1015 domain-containing protein [Eubacterium sp.]|nr:DUF1015 domain-containing protein [Eubacterium sp.]
MSYFESADILLPKKDFEKWSVIACDQHTSEPEYWEDVKSIVGDAPSALNIMLPEAWLKDENEESIRKINEKMMEYLNGDVLDEYKNAMIYVERTIGDKVRKGLVGVIDLEDYDYHKNSKTLIRATEETVEDRLPPRIQIRKDAPLEMPHILLLFDDPSYSVVKPLEQQKDTLKVAYDFELMKNGGHITGWFLDEKMVESIQQALGKLLEANEDLLFVVGDGNHSLAAAKESYLLTKNPEARYALVELENVHDHSIAFEPIYRVLFQVEAQDFIEKFVAYTEEHGGDEKQYFECITNEECGTIQVKATAKLPIGTLQTFIDLYMKEHPEVGIDYIHGEETVKALCKEDHVLGFLFEGMKKEDLFPAVRADGSLPRKTFSMGHADEKRFYIETRKIR